MSWKILLTPQAITVAPVGARALERLRNAGCELVQSPNYSPLTEAELLPQLPGMDAVLAGMDCYTEAVLASEEARDVKIISRWGVGVDAVDLEAASRCGIVIANTPGLLSEAVADFAMALMLAVSRRLPEGIVSMRESRWDAEWGPGLFGRTLGLVGCGGIGQAVARRAHGFGMRVLGCDPAPSSEAEGAGIEFVPLTQLLVESDLVSLHTALTPETRGLIGEPELRAMKPDAYLINTARGGVVDESALVRALSEEWIAGAALDVFAVEPLPADHLLRSAPNLLMTPHLASLGYGSGALVSAAAADAILEVRAGRRPRWVANPEVFDSAALRMVSSSSEPASEPS